MAEKLSIQIALEGGKEIERQLGDIGEAGKKAFGQIGKAAEDVGGFKNLKPDDVAQKLKQFGVTGVDAVNKIQAAVKSAGRLEDIVQGVQLAEKAFVGLTVGVAKFTGVATGLLSVRRAFGAVGVGIAAAVTGLNSLATATENLIVVLGNLATRGNVSVERLDAMRRAFMAAGGSGEEFLKFAEKLIGTQDKLKADKIRDLAAEAEKLKQSWSGDAVQRWLEDKIAALDRMAPAAKNVDDRIAEFARHMARLETNQQRFAALQRAGIAATQQNVDAWVILGKTIGQAQSKQATFTAAQVAQANSNQKAVTELSNAWQRLNEIIGTLGMGQTLTNMLTGLVQAFSVGLEVIELGFQKLPAAASAAWNAILSVAMPVVQTISQAWQGFVMAFTNGLAIIGAAWNAIWQGLQGAATSVLGMIQSAWDGLASAGTAAMNAIQGAIDGVIGTISSLIDAIGNAINSLAKLLGMGGGAGAPAGGGGGHARGGFIGGRGSGTSDSNLAWVSRGEHIMPARAVRQPGVLSFLEALRRSGGNLSRVLDGMGRFALGGMVRAPVPSFAGGMGGGANLGTLTLALPGGSSVTVRATSGVVDELRKAAAMAQVRSGGRKPSRYT